MKIEMFSCAGGMALGFRRAGIEFDFVIDKDPDAVASYETNLQHKPLQMDARDFLRMLEGGAAFKDVELLVADPPCTPWSRAGKRKGTADERDMLLVTCDIIQRLRPKAFLVGNIPGLDDSNNWPTVQKTLGAIPGYCIDYRALDAADYGIAQHRIRPFWFGHQTGPCLRWPRPTHGDPKELGHAELGDDRLPWRTCRDALEHLPVEELGTPARMRMRACNGKQLGSVGDRPARVVGTSNLSDGNVLTHPDGPAPRKEARVPQWASDVGAGRARAHAEGGRSQSYGHAGVLVPPEEHVVVRAGHHVTSPRHPTLEPDAPSTTIRGGGEGHSHPRLVLTAPEVRSARRVVVISRSSPTRPARTLRSEGGRTGHHEACLVESGSELLGNEKHRPNRADSPSHAITTKGDGRGAQGAAVMFVDGPGGYHVPQPVDQASATITAGQPGPRSRKALEWPWNRPSTSVSTQGFLDEPGHHGRARRNPYTNPNCIVLSEKSAAILQGFPEDWTFCGQTKRARWSQIGQAMPPGLAEAVARRIAVWFEEVAALNRVGPPPVE